MKFGEGLFGFDKDDYRTKINARDYSYAKLATNIYKKRRAIAISATSAVGSVAAAHITGGTSLIGTAWSARNISIEKQKPKLLEEEWENNRLQPPLKQRTTKDLVIPIIITGAIGAFAFTVDLAIDHATQTAAEAAAMGIPGYDFHGHLVGAYYTVIEKGASAIAEVPYVEAVVSVEISANENSLTRYRGTAREHRRRKH